MRTTIFSSVPYKFLAMLTVIAMMLAALPVMPAYAASITVTNTADDLTSGNGCSLREAIINANNDGFTYPDCTSGAGADTIILASGSTYTLTIAGVGGGTNLDGDLDIVDVDGLTIQASSTTPAIINGNDIDRVLDVAGGAGNLTLNYITVTNGTATTPATGGGISFASSATLTLSNSTVSDNAATALGSCGGGIYNNTAAAIVITNSTIANNSCSLSGADGGGLWKGTSGSVTITQSTFSGNSTADDGGGIRLNSPATITNSTFYNNTAGNRGGAIQVGDAAAALTIDFSTFSNNTANGAGGNGGGAIQADAGSVTVARSILANSPNGMACHKSGTGTVSVTDSVVEQNANCTVSGVTTSDPGLGALASNGGPTQTMAITSSSPAYNAADTCNSIATDQRGVTRPQVGSCDLGAYEVSPPTVVSIVRASDNPTSAATVDYTVTFSEAVQVATVGESDFTLTPTGDLLDATVNSVSGSGAVYTVTVNTGTGNGTLRLDVPTTATIQDLEGNNLVGLPFESGEVYTKFAAAPGAATPGTPSGTIFTNKPTYTWNEVFDATWYFLWVNKPDGMQAFPPTWYLASDICSGGVCSVTPNYTLGAGTHTWWLQTWNDAGYGPWSAGKTFTPSVPPAATPGSPSGSIGTNYKPTYTWNKVASAEWYYLWVNKPDGTQAFPPTWYLASDICGPSTCSVTPSATLAGGTHTWWLQTWNSVGYGPWSSGQTFTTNPRSAPGAATLVSPTGSITNHNPTYTWNKVSGADWYFLWVNDASGAVIKIWYDASTPGLCGPSTCSVTPATTLGSGSHTWWIQTWNAAGYGPWSSGTPFSLP